MNRVAVRQLTLALMAGMVGCPTDSGHEPEPDPDPLIRHELTISAAVGGSATSPGMGNFTCEAGAEVILNAVPVECYRFVNWTGDGIASSASSETTVAMAAARSITTKLASEDCRRVYRREWSSSLPVGVRS